MEVDVATFVCPLHTCANCEVGAVTATNRLARCLRCPVAYHMSCLPAGVEMKVQNVAESEKKINLMFFCYTLGAGPQQVCVCASLSGAPETLDKQRVSVVRWRRLARVLRPLPGFIS